MGDVCDSVCSACGDVCDSVCSACGDVCDSVYDFDISIDLSTATQGKYN